MGDELALGDRGVGRVTVEKLLVFDTETSGTSVTDDRILTCYAAVMIADGSVEREWSWTIDPGIEVPEGAAAVHGMSTQWIREHGRKDADVAIQEIVRVLYDAHALKMPIVAFNLRFDYSILWHEYKRVGRGTGGVLRTMLDEAVFYDPFVHDRLRGDKFRKGKRRLVDLCGVYGIEFNEDEAHEAKYDVLKTGELAFKLLSKEKKLDARGLMPLLERAKADHDADLEAYFKKSGKLNESGKPILVDRGWPLITKLGN